MSDIDIDSYDPQRVYDAVASRYARAARQYWAPAAEHLLDLAVLGDGHAVLDVACGPGSLTLRAARRVAPTGWAVGVDLSRGMLAEAQLEAGRDGVRNVGFFPADFHALPFARGTFDRVLCAFAIFFARNYASVVRDLWAIVKPGGVLAISTFASDNFSPLYAVYQDAVRAHSSVNLDSLLPAHPIFSLQALSNILERAGVSGTSVTYRDNPIALAGADDWWSIVDGTGMHRIGMELPADSARRVRVDVNDYIRRENITTLALGVNYAVARKSS